MKFKDKLTEKKSRKKFWTLLGTVGFLLIGVIAFLVGSYLTGSDVLSWFTNKQAIFYYVIFGVIVLPCIIYFLVMFWVFGDKKKK